MTPLRRMRDVVVRASVLAALPLAALTAGTAAAQGGAATAAAVEPLPARLSAAEFWNSGGSGDFRRRTFFPH